MNTAGLIKKIDAVFKRVNATDRVVYKRIITRTGGDNLLGRPGSVAVVDTALNPPPFIRPVNVRDTMVLNHMANMALNGTSVVSMAAYICTVSPTALSQADLRNKDMVIVLKGGAADEEFVVVGVQPAVLGGVVVSWKLALQSRKQ